MTALYGANFENAHVNEPALPYPQGELAGRVRMLYDEYDLDGAIVAASDTIDIGYLPSGAIVLDAKLYSPSMGATGIFDLGWAANGVDSADPNGFINQADAGGQAVYASMGAVPGALKKFEAETLVQIACTELTVATSGIIKVAILYIMD